MGKIEKLESQLEKSIEDFRVEIKGLVKENQDQTITADDIDEIGRQIYYVLEDFKKHIVEYLKENK